MAPQSTRCFMQEKELSATLQRTFQGAVCLGSYPKATIEVFVTVLESGGDDVGVVISAASLALADAGIELMDTVAACSVCRVGEVRKSLLLRFLSARKTPLSE